MVSSLVFSLYIFRLGTPGGGSGKSMPKTGATSGSMGGMRAPKAPKLVDEDAEMSDMSMSASSDEGDGDNFFDEMNALVSEYSCVWRRYATLHAVVLCRHIDRSCGEVFTFSTLCHLLLSVLWLPRRWNENNMSTSASSR